MTTIQPAAVVVGAAILRGVAPAVEVLAAQRARPPELSGWWEFPGGKVEPGEEELAALVREIGEQFADLNVRLEVHLESDRTHYANQVRLKNIHDLCVFDSSPMSAFRVLYEKVDSRVKGSWWEGYGNPEVETLLDEARRTVDRDRRRALYRQCYRILRDDPPWLYLYNHRRTLGFRGADPGWTMRPDGILDVRRLPGLAPETRR